MDQVRKKREGLHVLRKRVVLNIWTIFFLTPRCEVFPCLTIKMHLWVEESVFPHDSMTFLKAGMTIFILFPHPKCSTDYVDIVIVQ